MWDKVAKHMERLHINVSELADEIKIPATTIYTWKNKGIVINVLALQKMAKFFGCSLDDLM